MISLRVLGGEGSTNHGNQNSGEHNVPVNGSLFLPFSQPLKFIFSIVGILPYKIVKTGEGLKIARSYFMILISMPPFGLPVVVAFPYLIYSPLNLGHVFTKNL